MELCGFGEDDGFIAVLDDGFLMVRGRGDGFITALGDDLIMVLDDGLITVFGRGDDRIIGFGRGADLITALRDETTGYVMDGLFLDCTRLPSGIDCASPFTGGAFPLLISTVDFSCWYGT